MTRLVVAAVTAAVALAACGDDDDSGAPAESAAEEATTTAPPPPTTIATTSPATTDTTAATSSPRVAEPVTLIHRYGETTIDGIPERIVSLDMQWTDVLTALGTPPVAAAVDPNEGDWYPWRRTNGVEPIQVPDYTIPYETIAALRPDLILGSWGVIDQESYDLLDAIAPTVPLLADADVDKWQDMAAVAGEFLGVPDEAAALIAEAEQRSADVLADLPALAGKSYALTNYVPGDAIYVVADPDDGASQLFAELGMQIDPELLAQADGSTGRVELSLERAVELDSEVLLILTNGADPADIPGWSSLPAVQSGAVGVLDYAGVVGLNTPSPLSIPYSLELIRPALEAAATS